MSTGRHLLPVEVWLANDRVEIRKPMPAPDDAPEGMKFTQLLASLTPDQADVMARLLTSSAAFARESLDEVTA